MFVKALAFLFPCSSARIAIEQERLQLSLLDSAWLKKQVDDKSVDVEFHRIGGDVILTGTTEELQSFADRYATDEGAFANPLELHRIEPGAGEKEENSGQD